MNCVSRQSQQTLVLNRAVKTQNVKPGCYSAYHPCSPWEAEAKDQEFDASLGYY